MANERAMKCAKEWLPDCRIPDCPCEGPSQLRLADLIDRHFPVPTLGKEAEAAVQALRQACAEQSGLHWGEAATIIASAYAPLLKQAHDALAEAIDCIRVFHGGGTSWDIYESCSPEMVRIKAALAALREETT